MNSKKYIVSSLLIASFLAPNLIFAQGNTTGKARTALCGRLDNIYTKFTDRVSERGDKITQKRNDIKQKLEDRWANQDSKLAEKRDKWSQNRQDHFAKLEEKAQTDVQKQAVLAFVQAVQEAIGARKAAVDKAIADFRQGMENARIARQSGIDAVKLAFKDATKAAYEKAKSDCANNIDAATIRQNLKNDLQAAKTKYQADLKTIDQLKNTVDGIISARKAAIEKAIQDFKDALEKARIDFKTAMGQQENQETE